MSIDFNKDINYFDDNLLAKDWINDWMRHVWWELFENQENWIYMHGALGKNEDGSTRWPMLKANAVQEFSQVVDNTMFSSLRDYIVAGIIKRYHDEDIDVCDEVANWYNDFFGYEYGDKEYIVGKEPDPLLGKE